MSNVPTRWQYELLGFTPESGGFFTESRINEEEMERALNELGWDGWELAGVVETNHFDGDTQDVLLLFKRPLPAK
jgi:hypothetical protein